MAQAVGVSVRGREWLARFRERGPAALQNRSSAPRRVSARLPQRSLVLIAWLRRRPQLTGVAIARKPGLPLSTVARWLTRAGGGRLAALDPAARAALPARPARRIHPSRHQEARAFRAARPSRHHQLKPDGRRHRATGTCKGCRNRGTG
ncbi:hypothetical protein JMM59_11935 [Rhodovulum sulfidophilum]|nr:hypothetical protein [Rhodovulum sulfidophilum]